MDLFTKKIGPVFLKEGNSSREYIKKLKTLKKEASGEIKKEIEEQIAIASYGLKGEEDLAYYLNASRMNMYILHDIYLSLENANLSAQIDYIVITEKNIYVLECKNLVGIIEVNHSGDFYRTTKERGKERIPSPIEQNNQHLELINELYEKTQRNSILQQIFGSSIKERCKTLVVLANTHTILEEKNIKKEDREQIIHVDLLARRIKEIDNMTKKQLDVNKMRKLVDFFQEYDVADHVSFQSVYERLENQVRGQQEDLKRYHDAGKRSNEQKQNDLVAKLKAFRLEQSKKEKLEAFKIFNDAQMADLIEKNPKTKEELLLVSGFGQIKVEKYGDAILGILKRYHDVGKDSNKRQQDDLVAKLKAFRLEQSKKEKLEAFKIFNDAQMADLIEKNPKTKEELLLVSGFGQIKVEKYGDAILEILKWYPDVGKNNNKRQQADLVVKLKAFRLEQSKKEKLEAFKIFNDAQMADLIEKNPKTKEELLSVSGFGQVKAEKYGDAILEILKNS